MFVVSKMCYNNKTYFLFVGEPHLMPPLSPPTILPFIASLTCGQNIILPSSGVDTVLISCVVFNGSVPITTEVFKNGVSIGDGFSGFMISPFTNSDFGNYTFVASTKKCGSASAVSWILPG